MKAHEILNTAAGLVAGDRAKTHGDKLINHRNIAHLWTGWLRARGLIQNGCSLTAHDVAMLMSFLKASRTLTGTHNIDDYIDGSAYQSIAGEIAEAEAEQARKGSPTVDN